MLWEAPVDVTYRSIIADLARKATVLHPLAVKNWQTRASQLLDVDETEQAIAVLAEGLGKLPGEPALHLLQAFAYHKAGRSEVAREILCRAPAIANENKQLTIFRLELLILTRAAEDSAKIAGELIELDPTNGEALAALEKVSKKARNPELMIPLCQTALAHAPGHTRARHQLALAYMMLRRTEEARQLINLHQFVEVVDLAKPGGYANEAAFEKALAHEITCNPTLKPDPSGTATKNGLQTSRFPQPHDEVSTAALKLIRSAIDSFENRLPNGLDHPFIKNRPERAKLQAWAVVYSGEGRQSSHIHPDGWLSGVYYVSAPTPTDGNSCSGNLVLGAVEIEGSMIDPPWGTRDVRPAPGRLVMFPSYVPHAVIPTQSTEPRICIAFDVVPARLGGPRADR